MLTIHVCIGSACHLKGSHNVINSIQSIIKEKGLEEKVKLKAAFCLGKCMEAVSVQIDDETIVSVKEDTVESFMEEYIMGRLSE